MSEYEYLKTVDKHSSAGVIHKVVQDFYDVLKDEVLAGEALEALLRLVQSPLNIDPIIDNKCGQLVSAAMQLHHKNKPIALLSLRLTRKLQSRSYNLKQCRISDGVIRIFRHHKDPVVAIEVMRVVEVLGTRQIVAEDFVNKNFIRFMRHAIREYPKDRLVQTQTFKALVSIAHTRDIRIEFFQQGIGHYLIHSMRNLPNDQPVQVFGMKALRTVAGTYALIHLGAHTVVLEAMNRFSSPEIIIAGCEVIKSLSDMEYNVNVMLQAEACSIVISKLKLMVQHEKVMERGLLMFTFFGKWNDKKAELWNNGLGAFITFCCERQLASSKVLENAFGVINNMATVESLAGDMFNIGVVQSLLNGLKRHPKRSIVQERGIAAIRNISVWNQINVIKLIEFGAVPIVEAAREKHKKKPTLQKYSIEFLEKAEKLRR